MRAMALGLLLSLFVAACADDATTPSSATGITAFTVATVPTPVTTAQALPDTTEAPGATATTSASGPSSTAAPGITARPGTTASTNNTAPQDTTVPSTTAAPNTTGTTSTTEPIPLADVAVTLTRVVDGLDQPVFLDAPPGDARLFVLEQVGRVRIIVNGALLDQPFLDLTDDVLFSGELGLLGLAFHPNFPEDPRFYVHFSGDAGGETRIEEYRVGNDPDRADLSSRRTLLTVGQPATNHNGGMIAFGPDGLLYVGLGDGGGANDRYRNGQDTDSLLGAILRIDVDGEPYEIPVENYFADGGGAAEIWAWGLRNPWRFSFDGDWLFIGDVGQGAWEEIDVVHRESRGINLGWPIMEGTHCFRTGCSTSGLTPPVLDYPHDGGDCSVTGGYVYRGSAIPALEGTYFYGDFCTGRMASFRVDGEGLYETRGWDDTLGRVPFLTSFGTDGFGELYVLSADGSVMRLDPA